MYILRFIRGLENLARDLGEKNNIAFENPEILGAMAARCDEELHERVQMPRARRKIAYLDVTPAAEQNL